MNDDLLHDFVTHNDVWRSAFQHCIDTAKDSDDRSYWRHELSTFDNANAALRAELDKRVAEAAEPIPVSERLPPTGIIMVWPKGGGWETVFYDADDDCVNSGEWFGAMEKTCLYWMPLPSPPAALHPAQGANDDE